ncbi:type II toxin-antitoxin system HicB family antitoxin [Haloarcula argentinensis]|uniref:Type II toxin-antitoxin system HicB family antitoxin n=1 Tax=Haloarcula argentinensis TaxID=43776 RepID=A0A847UFY9_HALAR|nr:type II toxin-antitoxin system HicB family antitoxin [Haloarcula argentinensis]NLV12199.1 type II toxin-antitoxin system HicB family antitoxin [Haloarcula argentinensis]
MSEKLTENVELRFDEDSEQWSAHYIGLETPVSSCGNTREEALANLTDAVALFLD